MNDYEKLSKIIEEIDNLISQQVTSSTPEFKAWKIKAERFLIKKYGEASYEIKSFSKLKFSLIFSGSNTPHSEFVGACRTGLESAKAILSNYLEEYENEEVKVIVTKNTNIDCSQVFIVHGHDDALKQSVARILEKQDIRAIILSEQANNGKTIIEKFETNSDVGAAICLFTADDIGCKKDTNDYKYRARQNVIFEAGYFIGKIGREKVIILSENNLELPSDMQGIVYTDNRNWQLEVLKELKSIGYDIDLNKLL